jgi:class 3 adenylate cyclase
LPAEETETVTAQRKLTTILCADVAGYSRFMARDEELALRLLRAHREICAQVAALHGGRIFNTGGDSILLDFASPVEAVRAATAIQQAVETRNAALPEEDRMRFRIGINLGDVLVHGEDLLGDGVNVAARIQAAAPIGGVSLSGSVYDQIAGKLNLGFQELGERDFKNIGRSIRTFTITQAGERTLPRSEPPAQATRTRPRWPWAIAALVVLALGGGGVYWWQAEREAARIEAERQKAEQARLKAEVDRLAAEEARRRAARPPPPPPAGPPPATPPFPPPPPAGVTGVPKPPAEGLAKFDGVFNGRMCVVGIQQEPPRCSATGRISVRAGVVTGGWGSSVGNGRFHGSVDSEGRVAGQMDSQDHTSGRTNTAPLTGAIRGDHLILTGAFEKGGRRITVEMRRGP